MFKQIWIQSSSHPKYKINLFSVSKVAAKTAWGWHNFWIENIKWKCFKRYFYDYETPRTSWCGICSASTVHSFISPSLSWAVPRLALHLKLRKLKIDVNDFMLCKLRMVYTFFATFRQLKLRFFTLPVFLYWIFIGNMPLIAQMQIRIRYKGFKIDFMLCKIRLVHIPISNLGSSLDLDMMVLKTMNIFRHYATHWLNERAILV